MGIKLTINNFTTKIEGDLRTIKLLDKALAFRHPNSFYIRKRMGRNWDGFVHPLTKAGNIKTGLLPKAIEILSEYQDEYEILDYRNHLEPLPIPSSIKGLDLYPHQKSAVEAIVYGELLDQPHRRGLIIAGVNAGKTLMMFATHMSFKGARTLLLVDNTPLFNQMVKDAETVFGDEAGYMQGKKVKWGSFMVCMTKTLNNRLKDYSKELREYNILLVDEADLGVSATHQAIYSKMTSIAIRVGFTGTAFMRDLAKDKLRNNTIREFFGEALYEISMKELEDKGVNTKAVIKILRGSSSPEKFFDFIEEFNAVVSDNPLRHKRILNRIKYNLKKGRDKILVFNRFKEQTEVLYEYLKRKLPGVRVGFTHSGIKNDSLEKFKRGELDILVSSLYLKRGLNLPLIRVIINNSGGEFYSNPLQILGRGVRRHKSKRVVYFEDFYDRGKYLESHCRRRIRYYKDRGLTVKDLRVKK